MYSHPNPRYGAQMALTFKKQHLVKSAGPRDFQMLMQAAVASLDGICTVTPPYNTYCKLD